MLRSVVTSLMFLYISTSCEDCNVALEFRRVNSFSYCKYPHCICNYRGIGVVDTSSFATWDFRPLQLSVHFSMFGGSFCGYVTMDFKFTPFYYIEVILLLVFSWGCFAFSSVFGRDLDVLQ